jgi:hypothetical protein
MSLVASCVVPSISLTNSSFAPSSIANSLNLLREGINLPKK